jgi:hypothetical protein
MSTRLIVVLAPGNSNRDQWRAHTHARTLLATTATRPFGLTTRVIDRDARTLRVPMESCNTSLIGRIVYKSSRHVDTG